MSLFGLFQLGLLNGGYRIFSLRKTKEEENIINNLIYTYFLILFVIVAIIATGFKVINYNFGANFLIIILAILFGVITLINNWISTQLSAHMSFKELNYLEIISTFISLAFLFTIPSLGLWGALLTTFSNPLLYLIIAYYNYPYLLPTGIRFSIKSYRWILTFGFIPFLAGVFVQMHLQIERWSIVSYLNTEALGKFYLPTFYTTLFMMIPLSVNKLFFPPAVHKFSKGEFKEVKHVLKNYIVFNIVYTGLVVVATYLFMEPLVKMVLPQHLFATKWVWYLLPGLIAMLFLQPLEILYNAAVRLNPVFWTYFASVLFMGLLVFIGSHLVNFSLTIMAIIKSLVLIFILFSLIIYYLINKELLWKVNITKEKWELS
jgi:O-antigen/teichoic acid export membrane protein